MCENVPDGTIREKKKICEQPTYPTTKDCLTPVKARQRSTMETLKSCLSCIFKTRETFILALSVISEL